jgi:hypothetical protein
MAQISSNQPANTDIFKEKLSGFFASASGVGQGISGAMLFRPSWSPALKLQAQIQQGWAQN